MNKIIAMVVLGLVVVAAGMFAAGYIVGHGAGMEAALDGGCFGQTSPIDLPAELEDAFDEIYRQADPK